MSMSRLQESFCETSSENLKAVHKRWKSSGDTKEIVQELENTVKDSCGLGKLRRTMMDTTNDCDPLPETHRIRVDRRPDVMGLMNARAAHLYRNIDFFGEFTVSDKSSMNDPKHLQLLYNVLLLLHEHPFRPFAIGFNLVADNLYVYCVNREIAFSHKVEECFSSEKIKITLSLFSVFLLGLSQWLGNFDTSSISDQLQPSSPSSPPDLFDIMSATVLGQHFRPFGRSTVVYESPPTSADGSSLVTKFAWLRKDSLLDDKPVEMALLDQYAKFVQKDRENEQEYTEFYGSLPRPISSEKFPRVVQQIGAIKRAERQCWMMKTIGKGAPISRESLPTLGAVFTFLTDLFRSYSAVHAAGIAHRDVSMGNILVRDMFRALWLDFDAGMLINPDNNEAIEEWMKIPPGGLTATPDCVPYAVAIAGLRPEFMPWHPRLDAESLCHLVSHVILSLFLEIPTSASKNPTTAQADLPRPEGTRRSSRLSSRTPSDTAHSTEPGESPLPGAGRSSNGSSTLAPPKPSQRSSQPTTPPPSAELQSFLDEGNYRRYETIVAELSMRGTEDLREGKLLRNAMKSLRAAAEQILPDEDERDFWKMCQAGAFDGQDAEWKAEYDQHVEPKNSKWATNMRNMAKCLDEAKALLGDLTERSWLAWDAPKVAKKEEAKQEEAKRKANAAKIAKEAKEGPNDSKTSKTLPKDAKRNAWNMAKFLELCTLTEDPVVKEVRAKSSKAARKEGKLEEDAKDVKQ